MFIASIRVDVDPEKREEFEQEFAHSMRTTLDDAPGLVRAALCRPTTTAQPYLAFMEFRDSKGYQDWEKSSSFAAAHEKVGEVGITGPPLIESYDVHTQITA